MEARPISVTLKIRNGHTALYISGVYFMLGKTYLRKYLIFFLKNGSGDSRGEAQCSREGSFQMPCLLATPVPVDVQVPFLSGGYRSDTRGFLTGCWHGGVSVSSVFLTAADGDQTVGPTEWQAVG